jgi:hypothetical protein
MSTEKTRWTTERIARLGFLVGQGFVAKRIADDPLIASTPNNVYRQAQRFGLRFRAVAPPSVKLSLHAKSYFDAAAARRGITRDCLIELILSTIRSEPALLDNILDDGVTTNAELFTMAPCVVGPAYD